MKLPRILSSPGIIAIGLVLSLGYGVFEWWVK